MAKSYELPDPHQLRADDLERILCELQQILFVDDADEITTDMAYPCDTAIQAAGCLITAGLGPEPAKNQCKE